MTKGNILLAIACLVLLYSTASLSYSYALRFTPYPHTRAMHRSTDSSPPPSYIRKEERDEYKKYLREQKSETDFMYWDEWKLSKVFKKTLTQLEKENEY